MPHLRRITPLGEGSSLPLVFFEREAWRGISWGFTPIVVGPLPIQPLLRLRPYVDPPTSVATPTVARQKGDRLSLLTPNSNAR